MRRLPRCCDGSSTVYQLAASYLNRTFALGGKRKAQADTAILSAPCRNASSRYGAFVAAIRHNRPKWSDGNTSGMSPQIGAVLSRSIDFSIQSEPGTF